MNSKPLVSIITPLNKFDGYFKECYHSVINQDYKLIEWIIISSDKNINLIKSFIAKNKYSNHRSYTIFITCNENNVGKRRNIGIDNAKGELILFLDADDYFYSKQSISVLVTSIIKYNTEIVGASCLIYSKEKKYVRRNDLINKDTIKSNYKSFQNESGFYRFIYKSEFLKKKCKFPLLKRFQDSLFLVNATISVNSFYLIPDIVYVYRKGHKCIDWTTEMYVDHLSGVFSILDLSMKLKLYKLASRMFKNIYITNKIRKPHDSDYNNIKPNLNKLYLQKICKYKLFILSSPYNYLRATLSFIL